MTDLIHFLRSEYERDRFAYGALECVRAAQAVLAVALITTLAVAARGVFL